MAKFNWRNAAIGAAAGSVFPGLGTLAGGAIGGFIGGNKKKVSPRFDYPYASAGNIYEWATGQQKKYPYEPGKPYTGQLTAPMGPIEQQSQQMLGNYMGSDVSHTLGQAEKYTGDVLSGQYDPRQSPYYKSMKQQILSDAAEAKSKIMHEGAVSNQLHSETMPIQLRKLSEEVSRNLMNLTGGIYEKERDRMGDAVSKALNISKLMEAIPLGRIGAGTSYGAIPRQYQQSALDRMKQAFHEEQAGRAIPYNALQNLSGQTYQPYPAQTYTPGQLDLGKLTSSAMQLLPFIMMAL